MGIILHPIQVSRAKHTEHNRKQERRKVVRVSCATKGVEMNPLFSRSLNIHLEIEKGEGDEAVLQVKKKMGETNRPQPGLKWIR